MKYGVFCFAFLCINPSTSYCKVASFRLQVRAMLEDVQLRRREL
jgi:hypothetical protein